MMTDRVRSLPLFLAFALCLALVLPGRLLAAGDDVKLGLCKQALSRLLCKKPNEFGFVGKVSEDVYVVSVFYASKNSEYLCAVTADGQIYLQDRTWRAMRRVIPFSVDPDTKCATATFSNPECPARGPIKVCQSKSAQDSKEQLKETFWNRPIPQILEEEFKAMTAREHGNATSPAPAPAGQAGQAAPQGAAPAN